MLVVAANVLRGCRGSVVLTGPAGELRRSRRGPFRCARAPRRPTKSTWRAIRSWSLRRPRRRHLSRAWPRRRGRSRPKNLRRRRRPRRAGRATPSTCTSFLFGRRRPRPRSDRGRPRHRAYRRVEAELGRGGRPGGPPRYGRCHGVAHWPTSCRSASLVEDLDGKVECLVGRTVHGARGLLRRRRRPTGTRS